jgi:hypothetical protein
MPKILKPNGGVYDKTFSAANAEVGMDEVDLSFLP